jgi:hypothetical protein
VIFTTNKRLFRRRAVKPFTGVLTSALVLPLFYCPVAYAQDSAFDALADIAGEMRVAMGHLSKLVTSQPTQETQREVVDKLDVLIAQLEKECANCRGNTSPKNPSKPASDSYIKGGPGGIGDLHSARNDGKKWGELPAHERDRILQSLTDGFPPHYQSILQRYYKRLADEKPLSQLEDDAAAAKRGEAKAADKSSRPVKNAGARKSEAPK